MGNGVYSWDVWLILDLRISILSRIAGIRVNICRTASGLSFVQAWSWYAAHEIYLSSLNVPGTDTGFQGH